MACIYDEVLIAYARSKGLTLDYTRPELPLDYVHETVAFDTVDEVGLPELKLPNVVIPLQEHLIIPESPSKLLQDVLGGFSDLKLIPSGREWPNIGHAGDLKMELPVLQSDPELDMQRHLQTLEDVQALGVTKFSTPTIPLKREKDQSADFTRHVYKQNKLLIKKIETEPLVVRKSTMSLLQQCCLQDTMSPGETTRLVASMIQREKRSEWDPISPPLLPYEPPSPPRSPINLNTAVLDIPIFPDSDPALNDDEDAGWRTTAAVSSEIPAMTESQVLRMIDRSSPIEMLPAWEPLASLSIEEPLLPQDHGTAVPKAVAIGEVLDMTRIRNAVDPDVEKAMGSADRAMNETLEAATNEVVQQAEQERLSVMDMRTRVVVPNMDFSLPDPAWQRLKDTGFRKHPFGLIEHELSTIPPAPRWPPNREAERRMHWTPVLKNKVKFPDEETLTGGVDSSMIGDEVGPTSAAFVWKRPGIAALLYDDASDDDELETSPGMTERIEPVKRALLPEKRAFDVESDVEPIRKRRELVEDRILYEDDGKGSLFSPNAPAPSVAETSLATQGSSRTPDRREQTTSPFFSPNDPQGIGMPQSIASASGSSAPSTCNTMPSMSPSVQSPFRAQTSTSTAPSLPNPRLSSGLDAIAPAPRFIISCHLPASFIRQLERQLATMFPQAAQSSSNSSTSGTAAPAASMLVDRDYTLPHAAAPQWLRGLAAYESPSGPSAGRAGRLLDRPLEADVIVAPGTGIVLTSMIHVHQRALPGSGGGGGTVRLPPLLERVARIGERYERLFVLVSQGAAGGSGGGRGGTGSDALGPPSASDAATFGSLAALASTLETPTTVRLVGGGEVALARWAAELGARVFAEHASAVAALQGPARLPPLGSWLVEEETCWELWLRHAGFNPYAARAVVVGMRPVVEQDMRRVLAGPAYGEERQPVRRTVERDVMRSSELARFVRMNLEERVRWLEVALGGRKMLIRASRVLDTPFVQI